MAESVEEPLEKLSEQTTCSICLEQYADPKELQCHHVFCKKCLEGLLVNNFDDPETMTLTCPICRNESCVPGGGEGISKLKSAFHIQNLLDLQNGLRQRAATITSDRNVIVEVEEIERSCVVHTGEKANLYCESCKETICIRCAVQSHHQHEYDLIEKVSNKERQKLTSILNPAMRKLKIMETTMGKFTDRGEEIRAQRDAIEGQINSVIDQVQAALERKRTALIAELNELSSSKLVSLNMEKSDLHTLKTRLSHCVEEVRGIVRDESDEKVLSENKACMKMIAELSSSFQSIDTDPKERANMTLTSQLHSSLQNLDELASIRTYDECPGKCHAKGPGLASATVGENSTATILVVDHQSKPCSEGCINEIEFELVASINGMKSSGRAVHKKAHCYEISYQPTIKGCHLLSITIGNEHIFGSPFKVQVKSNPKQIDNPIQCITNITQPCGITLTEDGTILTVSEKTKGIIALKQNSELVREIGVGNSYTDIAVGDDSSLYALSKEDHEIHNFSLDGNLLKVTGRIGEDGPLKFKHPSGIAFNSKNSKVYVTNTGNHEIQVLNSDLTFHKRFGEEGSGKAQFNFPRGISCTASGKVIVADSENHRVQVFSSEGRFERTLNPAAHLRFPLGIATDSAGLIYVTERGNDRVSLFGTNGKLVKRFGDRACMSTPMGIAVDKICGTVLVCNCGKNSILIY